MFVVVSKEDTSLGVCQNVELCYLQDMKRLYGIDIAQIQVHLACNPSLFPVMFRAFLNHIGDFSFSPKPPGGEGSPAVEQPFHDEDHVRWLSGEDSCEEPELTELEEEPELEANAARCLSEDSSGRYLGNGPITRQRYCLLC